MVVRVKMSLQALPHFRGGPDIGGQPVNRLVVDGAENAFTGSHRRHTNTSFNSFFVTAQGSRYAGNPRILMICRGETRQIIKIREFSHQAEQLQKS